MPGRYAQWGRSICNRRQLNAISNQVQILALSVPNWIKVGGKGSGRARMEQEAIVARSSFKTE